MKLRVVVVDDSAICRAELEAILEEEGDIEVVGTAETAEQAAEVLDSARPDLATVDLAMPGAGGVALVERVMARRPLPLLVVTASPEDSSAFEAVRRGALEITPKPMGGDAGAAAALRRQVRSLAKIPVVRHIAGRQVPPPAAAPATGAGACRVVGIGCSAGGPAALASLLSRLPPEFPCLAIVQHLPPGFAASFAEFLRQHTRLSVKIVRERTAPSAGVVLLPPDNLHLVATAMGSFETSAEPTGLAFRPSIDVLLRSMARAFGPAAAGVVLTGIGSDGADGLLEMRKAGALTIAQSEVGCAVFGIPRAAQARGAAKEVVELENLPARLTLAAGLPGTSR